MPKKSKKDVSTALITGNWKMYKTIEEAVAFVKTLAPLIEKSQATVYLAVPFTAIHPTKQCIEQINTSIVVGAQNMNDAEEGAFTGEVAARMIKEAGAQFVILGHSERRRFFHETSAFINKKVKRALAEKIQPLLCVGESEQERAEGKTEEILREQLFASLEGVTEAQIKNVVISYEPVWAIGTGKVALPKEANSAHLFCRKLIAEKWGDKIAGEMIIQYGGSVDPENAGALLSQEHIDGLLVGGSSLSPESFSQIVNAKVTV